MISIVIWAFAITWSIIGTIFFLTHSDDVTNPKKRIVLRLVSGPFIWVTTLGFNIAIRILGVIDDQIIRFINWLRTP